MNILILSASIGAGHTRAALALQKVLPAAQVVDFTARDVSTLNWLMKKIYLAALRLIPDLYDRLYKLADGRRAGVTTRFATSALMYLPFARLLKKFSPDVIICTHPFPEAAASLWKFLHAKKPNFLLATVLTDYSLHEIWIYSEVDAYFVATEEMRRQLAPHCRAGQKIFATGIPIDSAFQSLQRTNSNVTRILIMGGGLGLGSIEETLAELNHITLPLNIVVVAGKNETLLARLKNFHSNHRVDLRGFVEDIPTLMANADLLITKPGALTLSEAFAAGVPMILHAPIPGPEALNADYAVSHGAALSVGKQKLSVIVANLLAEPERLRAMATASKKLARPCAADDVVEQIKKFPAT